MATIVNTSITIEEFLILNYINEIPAWEYINGATVQKSMGGGKHSLLQKQLVAVIDTTTNDYQGFPQLRCTFGNRSIVPDLVVVATDQISLDKSGKVIGSGINFAPKWIIEILSPIHNHTKVTGNILHSMKHGTKLGWLVDLSELSILVYRPDNLPELLTGTDQLPVLENVNLTITVEEFFGWLQRKK